MLRVRATRRPKWWRFLHPLMAIIPLVIGPVRSKADASMDAAERLLAAYPDHLRGIEGNALVWRDGTRMRIDDGRGPKEFAALISDPDLKDMFSMPYFAGSGGNPPSRDADPGRARNHEFFARMYGDCRRGEVEKHLVEITWLPRKAPRRIKVTSVNGVAEKLAAVSRELDELPASFDVFLTPPAGTYICRPIAGTDLRSAHGYGIAIDIATRRADYWRWSRPHADGILSYRNAIPMEIVSIFEKHGFIWGGRWYHFDTMHFEYRPELIQPAP